MSDVHGLTCHPPSTRTRFVVNALSGRSMMLRSYRVDTLMPGDGRAVNPTSYPDRVPDQNSPPDISTLADTTRRLADRALNRHSTVLYSPAGMRTSRIANSSSSSRRSKSWVMSKSTRSPLSNRNPNNLKSVLRVSTSQSMSVRYSNRTSNCSCRRPRTSLGRGENDTVGCSRRNPLRRVKPRAGSWCSSSSR